MKKLERTRIGRIIEAYSGLKQISTIKSTKRTTLITSMTNEDGGVERGRQGIADVFASFYEALYQQKGEATAHTTPAPSATQRDTNPIPSFTPTELDKGIKQLKNGKAADSAGIVAEMIKQGGPRLRDVLLSLYNDVILPDSPTPDQWKTANITVIHKAGDPKLPQNYRPITMIPMLYKLFARLLFNRLEEILDPHQSPDQAGFRRGFCTEDHLFTLVLIQEKAYEWQVPVWIATLDF